MDYEEEYVEQRRRLDALYDRRDEANDARMRRLDAQRDEEGLSYLRIVALAERAACRQGLDSSLVADELQHYLLDSREVMGRLDDALEDARQERYRIERDYDEELERLRRQYRQGGS
jgi:hypothetical protein